MTYAKGRIINDADSHTMETNEWLAPYLDGDLLEQLGELYGTPDPGKRILSIIDTARERKVDSAKDAEARENIIAGTKGWGGYGAFDTEERVRALDWLGFNSQLVFPTFGLGLVKRAKDEDSLYRAVHALNQAQADFCKADSRMIFVAFTPLDNPAKALEILNKAIELGAGAVMFAANAPGGKYSPGHPDFDPFWQKLTDHDLPFMLHIGPGTMKQPAEYHNNGKPRAPDLHGGGENLRFGDYLTLWYAPQMFLTAMVYDGVFMRNPTLRGAVLEAGAGWVPDFLRQLDHGYKSFKKTDPNLQAMDIVPSEYMRRAVKFSPFPDEDVGLMMRDGGADLFLFTSDYPHPEGTRDPIGKFEKTMGDLDEESKDMFYRRNYEQLMGWQDAGRVAVAAAE
jgi:predicted TIM-barrel fold metal-dependent hydrolase